MADTLMYIPNDDTQNYPLCRLQLVVKTFGHSNKFQPITKRNMIMHQGLTGNLQLIMYINALIFNRACKEVLIGQTKSILKSWQNCKVLV